MKKSSFLSPKDKMTKNNIDTNSPEYKRKSLNKTSWILFAGIIILTIAIIPVTLEVSNLGVFGFAKVKNFLFLPIICAVLAIGYVCFALVKHKHKLPFVKEIVTGFICLVVLAGFSFVTFTLSLAYTPGYNKIQYAESVSNSYLSVEKGDAYSLKLDNVTITYFAQINDHTSQPSGYFAQSGINENIISKCNFKLDEIPAMTEYYSSCIYNVTTNSWISQYDTLEPGTYQCFVLIFGQGKNINEKAGILITDVVLRI